MPFRRSLILGLIAATMVLVGWPSIARLEAKTLVTIQFGNQDSIASPVVVECPKTLEVGNYGLSVSGQQPILASVYRDHGQAWLAFIAPESKANTKISALLTPMENDDAKPLPTYQSVDENDGQKSIKYGSKLITTYHKGPNKPYFYPLHGPHDLAVTRAYPMKKNVEGETKDHPHQRSFFFTHGDVNGYDFWASDPENKPNPKFGKIEEIGLSTVSGLGVLAVLRTENDWLANDGSKVCKDDRLFKFFRVNDKTTIIDCDIIVEAKYGPVTFGETKEGAFGLRIASSMDVDRKKGGKITNAEGLNDAKTWGKASPWVDYTGPIQNQTVGIAVLNHPASFRYPTTWHVRTYGLFAANPFGYKDFGLKEEGKHTIKSGESMRLSYRVILHDGDTQQAQIANAFNSYAHPPKVTFSNDN